MQNPEAGTVIRVTAVMHQNLCTGLTVGTILRVGKDDRCPAPMDGYVWVESQDVPLGRQSGWVKWEPVVVLSAEECAEIGKVVGVLRDARVYCDSEPLSRSVERLRDERDTDRSMRVAERHINKTTITDYQKRIDRLESEVLRLSTPPGSSFGIECKDGKLKAVSGQTVSLPAGNWTIEWVEPPATPEPTNTDHLHARVGRQRRELRRLNQNLRLAHAELKLAQRLNEELSGHGLEQNKKIRVLESLVK